MANKLKTTLMCYDSKEWTTWALLMKKKNFKYDLALKTNVYYYQEFNMPEEYVLVLVARY